MRIFGIFIGKLDITDAEIKALNEGKAKVVVASKKVPIEKISGLKAGFAHIGWNRPKGKKQEKAEPVPGEAGEHH